MIMIDMTIPDTCSECRLSVRHFGKLYCPPLNDRVGNEGKDERCPLVDACDQFAEVSKNGDMISRADAIDAISKIKRTDNWQAAVSMALLDLPPTQPEIIYCKDCVKHNKGHGYYYDGTVIGIKDCCPLVEIRGRAQGHEFDYQFCAYAERRTDERFNQQAGRD